jgi:DNA-binding GntR family transcriptional regulator
MSVLVRFAYKMCAALTTRTDVRHLRKLRAYCRGGHAVCIQNRYVTRPTLPAQWSAFAATKARTVKAAIPLELAEPTATERVYAGVYDAILEQRIVPGMRLREEEMAAGFDVSRTVVRQALQRLAQDQLVELQHNKGAQVVAPSRERAAQTFDARRVIECEVARRLGGKLLAAQHTELHTLVLQEAAADARGDRARAIGLSGRLHRTLVVWAGNPIFVRAIDELLPITTLLMALYTSGQRPACIAHRHAELLDAFGRNGAAAAAEMKRHLNEIERCLLPPSAAAVRSLHLPRDTFSAYREPRA